MKTMFTQPITVSSPEDLNQFTLAQLVAEFNSHIDLTVPGAKHIQKFTDRQSAVRRTFASLEEYIEPTTEIIPNDKPKPTVTCATCGFESTEDNFDLVAGKTYCSDEDACIVRQTEQLSTTKKAKTTKNTTDKPSSYRITKSTQFKLRPDHVEFKTPQINLIISFFDENEILSKSQIIDMLDEKGFKQSGEKIFAWYQKELIAGALNIVSA